MKYSSDFSQHNDNTAVDLSIGLIGVGAMGTAIAAAFLAANMKVLTTLRGRSVDSVTRSQTVGMTICNSIDEVVQGADIVFSVVPCGAASEVASLVASACKNRTNDLVFVEANPVSRSEIERMVARFSVPGTMFVDAALIGLPPEENRRPILLVSGDCPRVLKSLDGLAFDIRQVGKKRGDASALKLLHSGLSKGTNSLLAQVFVAAQSQELLHEMLTLARETLPDLAKRAERSLPWIPADASRFQDEMDQLAHYLSEIGFSPEFAEGASSTLDAISKSPLGNETRTARNFDRDLVDTAAKLAPTWSQPRVRYSQSPATKEFALTLMTDDLTEAKIGDIAGVERIGPDLETLGKEQRQSKMNTRVSTHDKASVARFARELTNADVFCRINPIHANSGTEIDELIAAGATSIMLPYFHTVKEVAEFVRLTGGRARATILVETAAAAFRIHELVEIDGVDEVHIGLTDLMLSTKVGSRYQLLLSPLMDQIASTTHKAGKPLHLAGVACVGDSRLPIPADLTLARYVQLGVQGSLLTRAFCDRTEGQEDFIAKLEDIRACVEHWRKGPDQVLREGVELLRSTVASCLRQGKPIP
ncbi:MAG: aldolase/citrate lyase family protein [Dinoroseobacter sp.]|nr:aldolase/citrate lyase family protein [Dinoroseobacter sp.]